MADDMNRWRKANPWLVVSLQNSNAFSGRYPTRERAVAEGETYRGGVVNIDDAQKVVYVSEIPNL